MRLFSLADIASEPSDPKTFVGRARLTRMNGVSDAPPANVYRVAFEARARTHWHAHSGPQLLQIVEGTCRFQKAGEAVREAGPGDLIAVAPGERHWHGAGPDGPMTHVAVNIDAKTSWFEAVSDAEYGA